MEDRIYFTPELIDAWAAELDEQAWCILIEQLKASNGLQMQEFGRNAFKILEVLEDLETQARLAGVAPAKLEELAQFQATVRAQSVAILQAQEALAAQVQQADDGMDDFKALVMEYEAVRTEHRALLQQCDMELYEAREEAARQKQAAVEEAREILSAAQQRVEEIRRQSRTAQSRTRE